MEVGTEDEPVRYSGAVRSTQTSTGGVYACPSLVVVRKTTQILKYIYGCTQLGEYLPYKQEFESPPSQRQIISNQV